ncbi:hypothetical protein [Neobacillus drentensis]|uniref:hypothetical protein n=1 Tax=Neobacillus drentensis TaxID=220684 RepID=UPI00300383E9
MWLKSKVVLLSLCLPLLGLTIFTSGGAAKAEDPKTDGFVIEADRVVGSGMTANIIQQETSTNNSKLMLRIHYKSAIIYGMKLTKQVNSPRGQISINLKANGPVIVKNMIVDTSALAFKGACLKAAETIPELGMEQVVMVAHYMESEDSIIKQLVLNTVAGQSTAPKLGKLKMIQDLGSLPLNQLEQELGKIRSGHLPLTCDDYSKAGESPEQIGKITKPVQDVVEVVTKPLKPITKPLNPVEETIKPILKPLEPVTKPLEPVLKPLKPVTKPLEPVLKPLEPVTKQLEPGVSEASEKVEQILKSVCEQLEDEKGVIHKELALALIDEAIEKGKTLHSVCLGDTLLTKELQSLEESIFHSLNLIEIVGKVVPEDPLDQLNKMHDKIAKEKDGAIIYSP